MQHYVHHCHHQHPSKTIRNSINIGLPPFLVFGVHMHFNSNTIVIISLFGVPYFDGDWLRFEFLIFPKEMLTF